MNKIFILITSLSSSNLRSLKTYMIVHFRACGISRGTRKLACKLGVSTKNEKPIKPEKKPKKPNRKKKPIKILKKPTGSVL